MSAPIVQIISGAKFEVGDKVILLDKSKETVETHREYNHFWVESMNKYIGSIFTIKSIHPENSTPGNFWYYLEKKDIRQVEGWGFNEHWLAAPKPLDDNLFEI